MRTLTMSLRLSPPPCLASSPPSLTCHSRFFGFRATKRFHFLTPCSSLKPAKKQQRTLQKTNAPQSLRWLSSSKSGDDGKSSGDGDDGSKVDYVIKGTILAALLLLGVVGGFAGAGYVYKDQINAFLTQFSPYIEGIVTRLLSFSFIRMMKALGNTASPFISQGKDNVHG